MALPAGPRHGGVLHYELGRFSSLCGPSWLLLHPQRCPKAMASSVQGVLGCFLSVLPPATMAGGWDPAGFLARLVEISVIAAISKAAPSNKEILLKPREEINPGKASGFSSPA